MSTDQEAILRRCDHDANRTIAYNEFCEQVDCAGSPPPSSPPADDAGKQVASGGEEEELNDRVEDLDGT